jgi:drug/metabolite transporter (DMT)-like permease
MGEINKMNKETVSKIEILLSGFFFGTIPIFSVFLHRLEVSSFQQVFFRLTISILIILCSILLFMGPKLLQIQKSDVPIFFMFGFFLTMAYFTYLSSISLGIPASEAVFLTYTQPFFVIILGNLILNEKITMTKFMAAILSVVGAAMILQIWMINTIGYKSLIGYFLAILNGFFYASYIIVGRYVGVRKKYNFLTTTFWSFIPGLLWLIPGWFLIGLITNDKDILSFTTVLPFSAWSFLFGLAFFSTVVPYILLNKGLGEVKASQAGILLLIEPISVILMGALILQETLSFWQIIGAVLIVFSILKINYNIKS